MTRILALTNFYPPHSVGGDRSAADVLERLASRHHEITVLTSDHRSPSAEADEVDPRVDVYRELRLYWRDHDVILPARRVRLAMELSNRRALARALAHSRPEVVCIWTMGAFSLGLIEQLRRRRLPLVYAVCNDWLVWGPRQDAWSSGFADRPRLGRVVSAVTRLPTRAPDLGASGTFLFVSDWTRRYAERNSRWSFPDSAVVYSGIEAGLFGPSPDGSEKGWGWRLLYVGRLDPDKGPGAAVEALGRLPEEATLTLVGPGRPEQRRALADQAGSLGLAGRVHFAVLPREQLAEQYRRADVLLFPSRWEEPFGLTPLEAMACGTPVVATARGGSGEYLRDGVNCLVVPPERPDAMADAVRRLAGDDELRRRLVAAGLTTAAGFTTDALADEFEKWLVPAADRFSSGRPASRIVRESAR